MRSRSSLGFGSLIAGSVIFFLILLGIHRIAETPAVESLLVIGAVVIVFGVLFTRQLELRSQNNHSEPDEDQ